ncbi:MAG: amidase family protein [Acidobacteriota bacterium]
MTRGQLAAWMPGALALVAAETQPGEEPPRQGLALLGLEFKPEQLEMMRPGVERQLATYAKLRAVEISPDVDPAFTCSPVLPGATLRRGKGRFLPSRPRQQAGWKNLEELAFRPVTELAELVKARKVRSRELTRMYLERLKRHSSALLCTISLTEDLGLEPARRADPELNQCRYRGPLHGIPDGAKKLFPVKGYKTTWGAEPCRDQVIDANATVIERLDMAGAALCAKLSMGAHEMGGLWFGGMNKTAWNLQQSLPGSRRFPSGETLGPIVSPSAQCGGNGLGPASGRWSRTGAMALSWTMDKIGGIRRSTGDGMLARSAKGCQDRTGWRKEKPAGLAV